MRKVLILISFITLTISIFSGCNSQPDERVSLSSTDLSSSETAPSDSIDLLSSETTFSEHIDLSLNVLPTAITSNRNGLNISVMPQLELLSIVQYLGKESFNVQMGLISSFDTDYKSDINQYFQAYDAHPAVTYYEALDDIYEDIAINEPPTWMLFVNEDFSIDEEAFLNYVKSSRYVVYDTVELLQEFVNLLQDFYEETNFAAFFQDHLGYYQSIVQNTIETVPEENLISAVEDFFGEKPASYNVVLMTLLRPGGFGPQVEKEGQIHSYSLIGPTHAKNRIPVFGDSEFFTELEVHEFGHSFIPIAGMSNSPFANSISHSEPLFANMDKKKLDSMGYDSWDITLEEIILRACVVKIIEQFDIDRAQALLQEEVDNGFLYIETVYECISAKYVSNREQYPDFVSFLPMIIDDLILTHLST